ncbi:adipose [Carabus blaptoides fortunei]
MQQCKIMDGWSSKCTLTKRNVVTLLRDREVNLSAAASLQRHTQVTETFIKRLGLDYELEGHKGCVNCIEWSKDGRRLASGSDDTKVIIWDPFRHRKLQVITTPHIGNIFSVKFLGGNNDPLIVTGAGDCHVVVQSVIQEPGDLPILNCSCHAGRVKRITTPPDQPQLFWSAGEDGLIMQYDLREPHQCISASTVFLDLTRNLGWAAEAKCLAVNPTQPHLVAVGANDCFVRVYDRRMVKTTPYRMNHHVEHRDRTVLRPDPALDSTCVQYYAPGHLAKCGGDMRYKLAATYVAFDSTGTELLVNMGGEQVYLFDVNGTKESSAQLLQCPEGLFTKPRKSLEDDCFCGDGNINRSCRRLSLHNNKITQKPCACQYLGRASTLLQRKWIGDVYAAARDYLHVIKCWSGNKEAYLGLVQCLIALKWYKVAGDWLAYFRHRFGEYANSAQVLSLRSDLSRPVKPETEDTDDVPNLPEQELKLRDAAIDFETRYLGHCNTTTDIKEANFLGPDGQYIIAGSDDGIFFIWDRKTTNIVRAMWGDVSIVNCVQPHPNICVLATSGIDPVVKLWTPAPEDGSENIRIVTDPAAAAEANQQRISMDPFETMLANMGYRVRGGPPHIHDIPTCRTS